MPSLPHTTPARAPKSTFSRPGAAHAIAGVGCLVAMLPTPAAALDFAAMFSLKGQSVYGPGAAVDVNADRRLGPDPFDIGKEYGKIFDPCPAVDCPIGVRAGANTNGNFGLRYGAKINSGSYDLLYPVFVNLATPAAFSNEVGTPFKLGSSFKVPGYNAPAFQEFLNGQRMVARVTTHSPTIQAYVDLDAKFHAFVGAQVCAAIGCTGPALGPLDVDATRNLASLNRNNDRLFRLGDQTVELKRYTSVLDGNLTARLNLPNIDAVSGPAGSTGTRLQTFGRDSVVSLGANVGNMVSKALGVPLAGNISGIGYNLLGINAGIGIDLAQTISLSLTPVETYNFLSPVQSLQANGLWGAPTKQIAVPLGEQLTLKSNVRNVGVVPQTSLEVTVSNRTELVVQGDFNVQALAANVYGLNVGPLYDSGPVNAGKLSIPLFDESFSFAMGALAGLPFNIEQALPDHISAEGGFQALLSVGPQDANGLSSAEIRTRDLGCALILSCTSKFYANADPSMVNQFGQRVFMADADTLRLAANNPGEVGTDASQRALLLATGYSPDRIALVSPIGLPSPVPEPTRWSLMLLGFAAVAAWIRRGRRATP